VTESRPLCGSTRVARILWGLPAWSDDLQAALGAGRVALGGCVVGPLDPDRSRNACGHQIESWGSTRSPAIGAIYELLVTRARTRQMAAYSEVGALAGLHMAI